MCFCLTQGEGEGEESVKSNAVGIQPSLVTNQMPSVGLETVIKRNVYFCEEERTHTNWQKEIANPPHNENRKRKKKFSPFSTGS